MSDNETSTSGAVDNDELNDLLNDLEALQQEIGDETGDEANSPEAEAADPAPTPEEKDPGRIDQSLLDDLEAVMSTEGEPVEAAEPASDPTDPVDEAFAEVSSGDEPKETEISDEDLSALEAELGTEEEKPAELKAVEEEADSSDDDLLSDVSLDEELAQLEDFDDHSSSESLLSDTSTVDLSDDSDFGDNVKPISSSSRGSSEKLSDGELSIRLQGNMKLNLQYQVHSEMVRIGFEDGCLHLELSDGTEFKIPLAREAKKKAA